MKHGACVIRAVFMMIVLALGGCSQLVDSDVARLCRTLLPILDHEAERIIVVDTATHELTASAEAIVSIDYRVSSQSADSVSRRISCIFAVGGKGDRSTVSLGLAGQLNAVVANDGAVGPLRLHLLKQNWIGRGGAGAADPAPFATLGAVPQVRRPVASVTQVFLSALPIISIYALLAAAYALVYGLVGRINLAFGELTVLAGYGAFLGFSAVAAESSGGLVFSLIGGAVLAAYTGLAQGAALGRWVLAPLAGRPGQHVLIATIGLSLFWSELVRLTQGSSNRWIGPVFNRPVALLRDGDFIVTLTPMALVLPVIAGAAGVGLLSVMRRTRFGRRWRAFADDPKASALLGVDPHRLILATMLMAAGCAALAGYLTMLYYGGVGFSGGQLVGLKALIAAVIGGIGSVPGAMVGGIVLGLAEALWSAQFQIEFRDPAIFSLLVVMLAVRPDGLFGVSDSRSSGRF